MRTCKCGRPLDDYEKSCPACVSKRDGIFKKVLSIGGVLLGALALAIPKIIDKTLKK